AAQRQPDGGEATAWWGDERCVPPDDERSNSLLGRRSLLDRLERLPDVRRIRGELPASEGAAEYARELEGVPLDLLLLGLGPDAHAASLFPNSPQLQERSRLVTCGPAGVPALLPRGGLARPAVVRAPPRGLLLPR